MIYDTIILGAGASALMCAAHLPKNHKTLLVDTNEKIAKKIKISGGGRCNVTNKYVSCENYLGDKAFVQKVLQRFGNDELLEFIAQNGCDARLEKGRFYFCPKSSQQLIDIFAKLTKQHRFALRETVLEVKKKEEVFFVRTDKRIHKAHHVVVATGGASFKNLGASDIALEIARSFGLDYTPFRPALVGFTLQKEQFWFKELSGVSIDVVITVEEKKLQGSMLFAHRGISGPVVLNSSLYWKKGVLEVDFLPQSNLIELIQNGKKKFISSVLPLPKRFSKAFLKHLDIEDKECKKVSKEELSILYENFHSYRFAPAGNFGFSKAEVSAGGVKTQELSENFEVKKVKNLYFIGESVDVTGELGGYNFQWAFGSGKICAQFLINREVLY